MLNIVTIMQLPGCAGNSTLQQCDLDNCDKVTTALVASLVSYMFVVVLVIAFIIGFICGHCIGKKSSKSESPKTETPLPLHEDVCALPSTMHPQDEHGLELSENMCGLAYGSSC